MTAGEMYDLRRTIEQIARDTATTRNDVVWIKEGIKDQDERLGRVETRVNRFVGAGSILGVLFGAVAAWFSRTHT